MLKIKKIFPFFLLLLFFKAQGQQIFQKSYFTDTASYTAGNSFVKLSNGDYLCLGRSDSTGIAGTLLLLRIDSIGSIIWSKGIAESTSIENYPFHLTATDDGNFIITSSTGFSTGMTYDYGTASLIKIDENGHVIWSTAFIDATFYSQLWLKKTISVNNAYFSVGEIYTNSNFTSNTDTTHFGVITKVDANGNLIWAKQYGQHSTKINDFVLTSDSGFLLTGREETFNAIGSDQRLIYFKVDSAGIPAWAFQWDVPFGGQLYSVANDSNGFLIAGTVNPFGFDGVGLIFKTDYQGNILWSNRYGSPIASDEQITAVIKLNNQKIAFSSGGHDYIIADSSGNNPIYHGISTSLPPGYLTQIIPENNGGISGIGGRGFLLYVFKTDSSFGTCINYTGPYQYANIAIPKDTFIVFDSVLMLPQNPLSYSENSISVADSFYCFTSTSVTENIDETESFSIYPNPFTNELNIKIKDDSLLSFSIDILDVTGRQIVSTEIIHQNQTTLNLKSLSNGIYFIRCNLKEMNMVKPIIKN